MALNVSVIISAIDRLSGPVKGMSDRMQSFRQAGAWMTGAGAAINGTLLAAAKSAEGLGSQLNDMSLRTGVSGTSLSELKYAAEQTGGSLESVERGLRFVSRNAYDAANGGKRTAEAFDRLGVNVKDSSGQLKEADVLMTEVGTALRGVQSDSERTALAMAIFGRGGAAMLPMIMDAKGGIAGLREEARRLGLSLSEQDIAAADDFGDSMGRLSDTAGMAFKRIGFLVIPALTSMTNLIVVATSWFSRFSEEHPRLARGMVFAAAGAGILLAILGPILYLLPGFVNGWKIASSALSLSAWAARLTRLEMIATSIATKASGISATFAAGGFKAMASGMLSTLAAAAPVAAVIAVVLTAILALIGGVKLMLKLWDDVKNHRWGEALKDVGKAAILPLEAMEGAKQVGEWGAKLKGVFGDMFKMPDMPDLGKLGAGAGDTGDAKQQLASVNAELGNIEMPKLDAAGADLSAAADKQAASALDLSAAAKELRTSKAAEPAKAAATAAAPAAQPQAAPIWQKRTNAEGETVWTQLAMVDGMMRGVREVIRRVIPSTRETNFSRGVLPENATITKDLKNFPLAPILHTAIAQIMNGNGQGSSYAVVGQTTAIVREVRQPIIVQLDGKTIAENEQVTRMVDTRAERKYGDVARHKRLSPAHSM